MGYKQGPESWCGSPYSPRWHREDSFVLFSFVWVPVYQAASVDVILTAEELRDRKLIEVVNRTHRNSASRPDPSSSGHTGCTGALTIVSATVRVARPSPACPGRSCRES